MKFSKRKKDLLITDIPRVVEEIKTDYPEYVVNLPQTVGYPSLEFQEGLYRYISTDIFSYNITSVLDIGCGRGDYGSYIKKVINPDIEYTGIDLNPLLIDVGIHKFKEFDKFNLIRDNILNYSGTHDICILNYTFNNNYDSYTINKNDYLSNVIFKALGISNYGIVLTILDDTQEEPGIIGFNMSEIISLLNQFQLPYVIDKTYNISTYKIIISKENFN